MGHHRRTWKESKILNRPIRDRLENLRYITQDGHWLYLGHLNHAGYGTICYQGKTQRVHRLAFEEYTGIKIPEEMLVLHITTCTYKHCFNPNHLYIGDQKKNSEDRSSFETRIMKEMKKLSKEIQ